MEEQTKSSIQQNQTSHGKVIIEFSATVIVCIAAILPFLNNILGNFLDLSAQLSNSSGERRLDWDTTIYMVSAPTTTLLLMIGMHFGARIFGIISVLVSLVIQYYFIIKFIFFDKNEFQYGGYLGAFVVLAAIVYGLYKLHIYYTKILIVDKFKDTTLERFSSIIKKNNNL